MIHKHRLANWCARILALGIIACGAIICFSGFSFLLQSAQPFRENLNAIKGTIQQVNLTVVGLRNQSDSFNKYLEFLELSLAYTKSNLGQIDNQTTELFNLADSSSVKLLNESANALANASKAVRATANHVGGIPFDPLAEQRAALNLASENLTTISSELKETANMISGQVTAFKKITSSNLSVAKLIVETTEPQIKLLRTGPFERLPNALEALSSQLTAHVTLIDASYDLLNKVIQPVIAVGLGFMLLGLLGLLMHQSTHRTSIAEDRSNPQL